MAIPKKSQIEKFHEAAHAAETNDSEEAFNEALKTVAKAAPSKNEPKHPRIKDGLKRH